MAAAPESLTSPRGSTASGTAAADDVRRASWAVGGARPDGTRRRGTALFSRPLVRYSTEAAGLASMANPLRAVAVSPTGSEGSKAGSGSGRGARTRARTNWNHAETDTEDTTLTPEGTSGQFRFLLTLLGFEWGATWAETSSSGYNMRKNAQRRLTKQGVTIPGINIQDLAASHAKSKGFGVEAKEAALSVLGFNARQTDPTTGMSWVTRIIRWISVIILGVYCGLAIEELVKEAGEGGGATVDVRLTVILWTKLLVDLLQSFGKIYLCWAAIFLLGREETYDQWARVAGMTSERVRSHAQTAVTIAVVGCLLSTATRVGLDGNVNGVDPDPDPKPVAIQVFKHLGWTIIYLWWWAFVACLWLTLDVRMSAVLTQLRRVQGLPPDANEDVIYETVADCLRTFARARLSMVSVCKQYRAPVAMTVFICASSIVEDASELVGLQGRLGGNDMANLLITGLLMVAVLWFTSKVSSVFNYLVPRMLDALNTLDNSGDILGEFHSDLDILTMTAPERNAFAVYGIAITRSVVVKLLSLVSSASFFVLSQARNSSE